MLSKFQAALVTADGKAIDSNTTTNYTPTTTSSHPTHYTISDFFDPPSPPPTRYGTHSTSECGILDKIDDIVQEEDEILF